MPYEPSAFRQTNSQVVPGYAGNTLKEYSELLADKQQKYDAGIALYDELGNAVHGVVGNTQDNPQLQKLYSKYSGVLSEYAAKGNFEDMVPMVTRTARQFASEYQPFAAAYQQRTTYLNDLKKKLDEGKIDQNQHRMAVEASDNTYKGLQQDPLTGRWTGSYSGMGVVEKPDLNKAVDLAMKDHVPQNAKFMGFAKNGDYIYTNSQETKTFSADSVRKVVQSYLANDRDFQNYVQNYSTLLAGSKQYLKNDPNAIAFSEQVLKKAGTKKTKAEYETIQHTFKELQDKGVLTDEWLHNNAVNRHTSAMVNNALNYGVGKYEQNDVSNGISNVMETTESQLKRGLALQNVKENAFQPFSGAIAIGDSLPQDPGALNSYVTQASNSHTAAVAPFNERLKKVTKVKQADGSWKYFEKDASGKQFDVTEDIRSKTAQLNANAVEVDRLKRLDSEARKASGFVYTPAMDKDVQIAIEQATKLKSDKDIGFGSFAAELSPEEKSKIKNEVMRRYNPDAYDRYQKHIKGLTNPVTLSFTGLAPLSPSVNTAMSNFFSNTSAGAIGAKNGLLTLRYPVGNGTALQNTQLSEDDWNSIRGEVEFVGAVPTGDRSAPVGVLLRAKPGASEGTKKKVGMNAIIQTNVDVLEQTIRDPQAKAEFRLMANQFAGLATPGKEYTGPNGVRIKLEDDGQVRWWSPDNRSGVAPNLLQANVDATNIKK